jgi:serralysin
MTTVKTDVFRTNFNGDVTLNAGNLVGSVGDLFLFDNFGSKAIWLEDGNGNRLATSPNGFDLPFTGPTWHLAAAADFDSAPKFGGTGIGGSNRNLASDLLWQNDNGDLALWQSNGSNVNPFAPGTFNQENLPNPGTGWHVASANDFDGNFAADILFQHTSGVLAIWEFQSAVTNDVLAGAPVIKPGGQLNVDQNPGATWHVAATGDITGGNADLKAGIVFQNDNGAIAAWENPTVVGGQIHFNIQSDLPNPGTTWQVVGMGNITENGFNQNAPGQDLVLQNDNGNIAIWQLAVVGNQVVRDGANPAGFDLGNPGAGWHVVGVRDMDADTRADILLQNDNGAAAVWTNIQPNGTHGGFNINPNPNPSGHLDWHVVKGG